MLCVAEAVSAALIPVVRFVYVREDGAPFAKCPVLMYAAAHAPVAIPFELFATGGNPGVNVAAACAAAALAALPAAPGDKLPEPDEAPASLAVVFNARQDELYDT